MANSGSNTSSRKTYEKPAINGYSAAELIELIGPAVAIYGPGGNP